MLSIPGNFSGTNSLQAASKSFLQIYHCPNVRQTSPKSTTSQCENLAITKWCRRSLYLGMSIRSQWLNIWTPWPAVLPKPYKPCKPFIDVPASSHNRSTCMAYI